MAQKITTALVLSGGGMFGAWQAGVWRALAPVFKPDLIVGASVGSLNGYAIASGWTPDLLCEWWLHPEVAGFKRLPETIRALMAARPLEQDYAVVVVNSLRMKPETFVGSAVHSDLTPLHLLASCAVPGAVLPQRLNNSWYVDGGLLNPLPVWAAVELGATRIIGLNVLPNVPSVMLGPFVKAFRGVFGHKPPLPTGVELNTLIPSFPSEEIASSGRGPALGGHALGSMRDALVWNRDRIERWIDHGSRDGAAFVAGNLSASGDVLMKFDGR
jgi:NTE family protein